MLKRRKLDLIITSLTVLAAFAAANAATSTTTTTESHTYTKDGNLSSSSRTLVISDKKTNSEICKALDTKIDSYPDLDDDVSFKVQDGVITLKGTVDNTSERDLAGMIAKDLVGVVRVDNLIDVE